MSTSLTLQNEIITELVHVVRCHKVLLDEDLAKLYGIETKNLNRAVSRNSGRFPEDFMFQLTKEEYLRFQDGTSSHGGRRHPPKVFTELGVAMLSSVLNSDQAIAVNIQIMRTFVQLRKILESDDELAQRLSEIEKRLSQGEESREEHEQYISAILDAIKAMRQERIEDDEEKEPIGFQVD